MYKRQFFGNEYPFFAWMNKLGLSTEGGPDGVTVLKQSFDVQPLIQKQADCISVMTYNEYGQALDAGYSPDNLTIFNYTEMGNDLLEDGLYAMEDKLADPACAVAVVDAADEPAFQAAFTQNSPRPEAVTNFAGFNYSNGHRLALTLYRMKAN